MRDTPKDKERQTPDIPESTRRIMEGMVKTPPEPRGRKPKGKREKREKPAK